MLSYWEKEHLLDHDLIIIGGGITGLSCAAEVLERHPKERVLVVERGLLPTGASTKNAGFACFGSLTELLSDIDHMGADEARVLVRERVEGLRLLRQRLGDQAIGYRQDGGYELLGEPELSALPRLQEANELLHPLFQEQVYSAMSGLAGKFGFDRSAVRNVIHTAGEGQVNTGLMMRSLMAHVGRLGAQVMTGAEVVRLSQEESGASILQVKGALGEQLELRAARVAVCTNAFARRLLPGMEVVPGRGQVLCTSPVPGLKFRGSFHMEEGYYYFRNIGDRVIFGGGRNLDMQAEETDLPGLNEKIGQELDRRLREVILPGQSYEIAQRWSGTMAFGPSKSPLVRLVAPHVAVGVRLSGMGVALGSKVAQRLSEMLYPV